MPSSLLRGLAVLACLATAPALAQSPSPSVPTTKPAPAVPAPSNPTPPTVAPPQAPAAATKPDAAKPETKAEKAALIDLNSASPAELDALPGIGAARAAAIVKGRPYRGKDELVSKKVLSQGVYDGIKEKVIARQK